MKMMKSNIIRKIFFRIKNNLNYKKHMLYYKKVCKYKKKKPTKKELCDYIVAYLDNSSLYMLNDIGYNFIKNNNRKYLIDFVLKYANKGNLNISKIYFLAKCYYYMTQEYNNLAIYYCEEFLKRNTYYKLGYDKVNVDEEFLIQKCEFYFMLANLYDQNLVYDQALEYAFLSKSGPKRKYYWNSYLLIGRVLFHQSEFDKAILYLKYGWSTTKNDYEKKEFEELIKKCNDYIKENKQYVPRNIKRPRIDISTNKKYELITGELLD